MTSTVMRIYANSIKETLCKVISGEMSPSDDRMCLRAVISDVDKIVDSAEKSEGRAEITETRKLYREDLRNLCIKNNWYTRGTSEEYDKMLTFAESRDNITAADIVKIAEDIIRHSVMGLPVSATCFIIAKACNSFFENPNEEEAGD